MKRMMAAILLASTLTSVAHAQSDGIATDRCDQPQVLLDQAYDACYGGVSPVPGWFLAACELQGGQHNFDRTHNKAFPIIHKSCGRFISRKFGYMAGTVLEIYRLNDAAKAKLTERQKAVTGQK